MAEIGNLGTQKLDADQAMATKQAELNELRANSQRVNSEYEAALRRLPKDWQHVVGFSKP
jgi:hypothetical protein